MKFIFPEKASAGRSLRARLFIDTLRRHLVLNATHEIVSEPETLHDPEALAIFDSLGALDPGRQAEASVFVGLPVTPQNMTGRNILICPCPLIIELEAFAARFKNPDAVSKLWPLNLLSAFERTVFLDRYDLQASYGFAPWIKLSLADRFPLLITTQTAVSQDGIALFVHSDDICWADGSEFRKRLAALSPVAVITGKTCPDQLAQILAQSAVHVHFGWSSKTPTVGFSPLDSITSGAYTLIALPEKAELEFLGGALLKLAEERAFFEISRDPDQWVGLVQSMLERAKKYRSGPFQVNPEISRHAFSNSAFISEGFKRFERQVSL